MEALRAKIGVEVQQEPMDGAEEAQP
jgi:hypothetical protein